MCTARALCDGEDNVAWQPLVRRSPNRYNGVVRASSKGGAEERSVAIVCHAGLGARITAEIGQRAAPEQPRDSRLPEAP